MPQGGEKTSHGSFREAAAIELSGAVGNEEIREARRGGKSENEGRKVQGLKVAR